MIDKLEGQILYLSEDEVNDFVFNPNELNEFAYQPIKGGVVSDSDKIGMKTVIFDVVGTNDFWNAYVKGFFYEGGKFLGHFYYTADSKLPKESIDGMFAIIEGGCEIKGRTYEGGKVSSCFYLHINTQTPPQVLLLKKEKSTKTTRMRKLIKNTKRNEVIDTYPSILNSDLLKSINIKADKKKKVLGRNGYLMYDHVIKWKPSANSGDDLIIAMCIAYSWMPTMLDIYVKDKKELNGLLKPVQELGKIKTLEDFDKQTILIEASLTKLSKAINNSTVGASKTLHIFYPESIPIIDSNVLKGWNLILKKYYKKNPELKLPVNISSVTHRQVNAYMRYWRLILMMKRNTKSKSVRQVEEPFYWLGIK